MKKRKEPFRQLGLGAPSSPGRWLPASDTSVSGPFVTQVGGTFAHHIKRGQLLKQQVFSSKKQFLCVRQPDEKMGRKPKAVSLNKGFNQIERIGEEDLSILLNSSSENGLDSLESSRLREATCEGQGRTVISVWQSLPGQSYCVHS